LRAIAGVLVSGVDAGPCPIQSPTGSLRALHGGGPPTDRRVHTEVERRRRATVGVVIGVREAPRSCSESDSIAEAIERRPAGNDRAKAWKLRSSPARESALVQKGVDPGVLLLARRRHRKAHTGRPSGRNGNWVLDGERHSDS
jgi:hypothetical protein